MWEAIAAGIGAIASGFLGGAAGQAGSNSQGLPEMSWGSYRRAQDQMDEGNVREIGRQGQFLQGMAPSQASAYNTYQDATYGEDTARQQSRLDTLFPGTSPWERLGANPASPLPSPTMGPSQSNSGGASQFMAQMATTAIQAKTSEKIARMNNQTALQTTAMQTGQQMKSTEMQTAGGALPKAQAAQAVETISNIAQQTRTGGQQERLTAIQAEAAANQTFLNSLEAVAKNLPKETLSIGPLKTESNSGWRSIIAAIAKGTKNNPVAQHQTLSDAVRSLSQDQFQTVLDDLKQMAGQGARTAGNWIGEGAKFLTQQK